MLAHLTIQPTWCLTVLQYNLSGGGLLLNWLLCTGETKVENRQSQCEYRIWLEQDQSTISIRHTLYSTDM